MLRQIKPPFKPTVRSDTDVANFDKTFTKMPAQMSPPVAVGAKRVGDFQLHKCTFVTSRIHVDRTHSPSRMNIGFQFKDHGRSCNTTAAGRLGTKH